MVTMLIVFGSIAGMGQLIFNVWQTWIARQEQIEMRIIRQRLVKDEARMVYDEERLARDEERLAEDEKLFKQNADDSIGA